MTPILGIIASSNFRVPTAYESIATTTVGSGGTATITFSSIPATYTHLQIRYFAKNTSADYTIRAQFNSDTAANYSYHGLYGDGANDAAYAGASQTFMQFGNNADTTTSVFAAGIIDILDYTNTNKYKTIRALHGYADSSSNTIMMTSILWRNTARIEALWLNCWDGSFASGSRFSLYGLK
jgi:hypothetical protein